MQLWNTINWETGQAMLFIALAGAVIGAGVVLLFSRQRLKNLGLKYKNLEDEFDESQRLLQLCKEEKSLIRADVQKLKRQKNELKIIYEDLKSEHERLRTENQSLVLENQRNRTNLENAYNNVEDLKDQIIGLKAKPYLPHLLEEEDNTYDEHRLYSAIQKLEHLINKVEHNGLEPK